MAGFPGPRRIVVVSLLIAIQFKYINADRTQRRHRTTQQTLGPSTLLDSVLTIRQQQQHHASSKTQSQTQSPQQQTSTKQHLRQHQRPLSPARSSNQLLHTNLTTTYSSRPTLSLTPLPGAVDVTHDSTLVLSSADLRPYLYPGCVLHLDRHLPFELDGAITENQFSIQLPYPYKTAKGAPVSSTNLRRIPALSASVTPKSSSVTLSSSSSSSPSSSSSSSSSRVLSGDSLFLESEGPFVVLAAHTSSSDGTVKLEVDPPFPVNAPTFAHPLRVFRLLAADDPSLLRGAQHGDAAAGEDAESVIDRVAQQASSLFGNAGQYGDVHGVRLPGTVAVTFDDPLMKPTHDLRAYLSPGDVLKVGSRFPFVVSRDPPLSSTQLYSTSVWTGADAPALPAYKTRLSLLPGSVSVTHNSRDVTTTADLRALLQPSDVVVIANVPHLIVSETITPSGFALEDPFPGPTMTNAPIFLSGWHALPGTVSVTHKSSRVDSTHDLSKLLNIYDEIRFSKVPPTGHSVAARPTATGFPMRDVFPGASQSGLRLYRSGGRVMPGTVAVTRDSPVVATTDDLRSLLLPGDVIRIAEYPEALVAGGEFGEAELSAAKRKAFGPAVVAPSAFQTMHLHTVGPSKSGLLMVTLGLRRLPTLVSAERDSSEAVTTTDVSDYVVPGSHVSVGPFRRLTVAPTLPTGASSVSATGFLFAMPYPGASVTRVPLYLNTGALGGALGRRADGSGEAVVHTGLGTVSAVNKSPFLKTSKDLSELLHVGDVLRVGSRTHLVVAEAPTATTIRMTLPWPDKTQSGLALGHMVRRLKLSGTVSVTHGEPTAKTSVDLRSELSIGDVVEISALQFVVVSPMSASVFTLSEAYPAVSASGVSAYRVLSGGSRGAGLLMPGTVSVTKGRLVALTTEDLSGTIAAGDRLRVGLREVTAQEPINGKGFSMTAAWMGTTARGLKAFNLGKSGREVSLEELARLKLQCRSIYCLAKIEEQERAVPTEYSRSLNAGHGALQALSLDAAKNAGTSSGLAVDPEVEKEWRKWYTKAKAKLELKEDKAVEGAKERVDQVVKQRS